ncbi:auxin efflux carrier family protein [Entomortierella parvispora]|uniref:Auxin efflux carrier family protein n=1 Tax=Entomortierella parvispora TaxID=205924 RepID=A0A9P3LY09_9FUNG|nr:auxin efflux carrier family protein [Entomortierella parvispora]
MLILSAIDWGVLAEAATEAFFQVLVVVFCGIVLAKTGHLSPSAQKSITKVNLYFFTPCLIFTKIASALSWDRLLSFWPIPVFYVCFSALSLTVSRIGAKILGFNSADTRFATAGILFFNNQSLPLALIHSLALSAAGSRLLRDEDDTKDAVVARGVSYILFYSVCDSLVRWSYGINMLANHPQDNPSFLKSAPISNSISNSYSAPQESQGVIVQIDPEYENTPNSNVQHQAQGHSGVQYSSSKESLGQRLKTWFAQLPSRLTSFLTPPLVTACLALLVALVPPLHRLMMSPESKVYTFLVRPLETCSNAAVPLILVCLGAQVVSFDSELPSGTESPASTSVTLSGASSVTGVDDEQNSQVSGSTAPPDQQRNGHFTDNNNDHEDNEALESQPLLGPSSTGRPSQLTKGWLTPIQFTIVGRMVVVPSIALPLILFCPWDLSPILTADPAFRLTLVLMISAPTAINLIQICQITGFQEKNMANLLFWSYVVFAVPCVLAWAVVALWASSWKP